MTGPEQESPSTASRLDTSVAHAARRYDYWLGGKDNFAVDQESGDVIAAAFPTIRLAVRENRSFLRRAVTFLAEEAGIRQFLDIGTGLPTANNTHQVAQAIAPRSRIVYVDNDRYLSGSMHTWLVLLKGAARGTRGGVSYGSALVVRMRRLRSRWLRLTLRSGVSRSSSGSGCMATRRATGRRNRRCVRLSRTSSVATTRP